ncbi:MAG: hypothetical protein ACRDQA_28225 [Nocardioidaceae bacterium]
MAFTISNLGQLFVLGNALATGGLFVVAVAAWLSRRTTTAGAWWAIVAGGSATVAVAVGSWLAHGDPATGFFGITPVYAAFIVGTLALIAGSLLSSPLPEEDPDATLMSRRLWKAAESVPAQRH